MATTSKTIDMKLQVRVEDASSGTSKVKNLSFSKIKVSATADELYAAGNAIASLQSRPLSGLRTVATSLTQASRTNKKGEPFSVRLFYCSSPFPYPKPSPMGKATIREHRYPHIDRANTCMCGKTIPMDKAFPAWGRWRA